MAVLHVNVDHVATIREARKTNEPDPVIAATQAELAGAMGITVHLREDRRHIQDRDIYLIRQLVQTKMNLEMAATDEMVKIALDVKPHLVTLVPEKREEVTTEGGLDCINHFSSLQNKIKRLQDDGIPVSLFIDPDPGQIESAKKLGAKDIEIHTGEYANAQYQTEKEEQLQRIYQATLLGKELGLQVNAGHGLTYFNVSEIAKISEIQELNIGHSIISRSVYVGIYQAVKEMCALISS